MRLPLALLLLALSASPAAAVWTHTAKYWDAGCGGPPVELTYAEVNATACAALQPAVGTCTILRNGTGAIVGGQRVLRCEAARPANWSMTYPDEMEGNYIVSTYFSTPFAFFVDVQTMCCDLPVMEHTVRLNSTCSPNPRPTGPFNWTYLECADDGEGLQFVCSTPTCAEDSCMILNKYNPRACQGGGGSFQRAYCLRAGPGPESNWGRWPAISPRVCNDTVYTQKPGHEPPWTKNAAGRGAAGFLGGVAAVLAAVALL
ncbi:hypothetical protein DFJ74DRAFT_669451 [Hyaloraphidium curvatum]|nr:hypothetical protein DFJ74DRAFT_669451 [Hyaloraphidium curvatum]